MATADASFAASSAASATSAGHQNKSCHCLVDTPLSVISSSFYQIISGCILLLYSIYIEIALDLFQEGLSICIICISIYSVLKEWYTTYLQYWRRYVNSTI